jgi:hypothetical protein
MPAHATLVLGDVFGVHELVGAKELRVDALEPGAHAAQLVALAEVVQAGENLRLQRIEGSRFGQYI